MAKLYNGTGTRLYIDYEIDFGERVMLGVETKIEPEFQGKEVAHKNWEGRVYRVEQTPTDPWYDSLNGCYYSYRVWKGHKPVCFANDMLQAGQILDRLMKNLPPIDPYEDLKEEAMF